MMIEEQAVDVYKRQRPARPLGLDRARAPRPRSDERGSPSVPDDAGRAGRDRAANRVPECSDVCVHIHDGVCGHIVAKL